MNDASPSRQSKFVRYRARKKAKGLREVRMWVPDVRSPQFQAQAQREAALLRGAADEQRALDFIEAITGEDPELYK